MRLVKLEPETFNVATRFWEEASGGASCDICNTSVPQGKGRLFRPRGQKPCLDFLANALWGFGFLRLLAGCGRQELEDLLAEELRANPELLLCEACFASCWEFLTKSEPEKKPALAAESKAHPIVAKPAPAEAEKPPTTAVPKIPVIGKAQDVKKELPDWLRKRK